LVLQACLNTIGHDGKQDCCRSIAIQTMRDAKPLGLFRFFPHAVLRSNGREFSDVNSVCSQRLVNR
jgi:hypothetical protein